MVAMHIGRASKGRTGAPAESERQACGLKGPDIKKEIDMEVVSQQSDWQIVRK